MRRNADEDLRALERRAAAGDPVAQAALRRELVRLGRAEDQRAFLIDLAPEASVVAHAAGVRAVLRSLNALKFFTVTTGRPNSENRLQIRVFAKRSIPRQDEELREAARRVGLAFWGVEGDGGDPGRPFLEFFVYLTRKPDPPSQAVTLPERFWPIYKGGVERGQEGKRRNLCAPPSDDRLQSRAYAAGELFHVRLLDPDEKAPRRLDLQPYVPRSPMPGEDRTIPRVCLAETPGDALSASEAWKFFESDRALHIYTNAAPVEGRIPPEALLPDVGQTGEVWCRCSVPMVLAASFSPDVTRGLLESTWALWQELNIDESMTLTEAKPDLGAFMNERLHHLHPGGTRPKLSQKAKAVRCNPDPLEPLLVAEVECLDGRGPNGEDLWRKRVSDAEIMTQIATLDLPDGWLKFLAELVCQDALPIDPQKLRKAGFRRTGRTARGFSALGLQVQVEGWGESCLEEGLLYEGDIPGSGDGRLQAYIDEQTARKRTLPSDDIDAVPPGARRWLLSLWLPAAPKPHQNSDVVSVDLWEGSLTP